MGKKESKKYLLFSVQNIFDHICCPFHPTWMSTTPMWQNGGWTWAASSRTLWSRYPTLSLSLSLFTGLPTPLPRRTGSVRVCGCSVTQAGLTDSHSNDDAYEWDVEREEKGKNAFQELLIAAARRYSLLRGVKVIVWFTFDPEAQSPRLATCQPRHISCADFILNRFKNKRWIPSFWRHCPFLTFIVQETRKLPW